MTQRERDSYVNASLDHDAELKRSGHLIMAQALKTPPHAVSVRKRDGKVSVTDGPFAETKEHLGGFVLIEARDLNEAIKIASDDPLARVGTIEVRPFEELTYIDISEEAAR
ncbi:YciI family protein [Mesorhizobium sp. WSM2239]|uniref:YciI family protein n=2 Tax=unclassified Mesorhizobium TaxID=325217 RepID=A0AAU8DES7_9HYPH